MLRRIPSGLTRLSPAAASLLSVVIFALALRASLKPDGFNNVLYDYAAWASAALALYAAAADLKLHRRASLLGSTALFDVVGATLVLTGRAASALANVLRLIPYFLPPLLGQPYTPLGLTLSLWLLPGSLLILAATALHALRRAPLELAPGATAEELLAAASRGLERAWSAAASLPWTAPLAAAAFALALRLTPELLWWPWPIGWDTIEYIAHLLDFAQRPNPFEPHYWMGGMRNIPPLLDILLLPAALLGHAWTAFKLYPPIAYAALVAAAVLYAQKALGLGWRGSLLAGLATALYILNLRISWDYQRQLLGSVLMLLSLAHLDSRRHRGAGDAAAAASLLVLTALSHEVTALAAIFLAAAYALAAARHRDRAALAAGLAALSAS
ncbi:MAG: hypothetical protein ABWK00_06235, partial [Desulfurococcaceae archaeon]